MVKAAGAAASHLRRPATWALGCCCMTGADTDAAISVAVARIAAATATGFGLVADTVACTGAESDTVVVVAGDKTRSDFLNDVDKGENPINECNCAADTSCSEAVAMGVVASGPVPPPQKIKIHTHTNQIKPECKQTWPDGGRHLAHDRWK